MRLTLKQKEKMFKKYVIKRKSIFHAWEIYGGYDKGDFKCIENIFFRIYLLSTFLDIVILEWYIYIANY